jgi:hypothetical protein
MGLGAWSLSRGMERRKEKNGRGGKKRHIVKHRKTLQKHAEALRNTTPFVERNEKRTTSAFAFIALLLG